VKHFTQINAEVIKRWTTTEVYTYILARELPLNTAYRLGLDRVGCSVCPFASQWTEYMIGRGYLETVKSFINQVEKTVESLGIEDKAEVRKYISEGNWKKTRWR